MASKIDRLLLLHCDACRAGAQMRFYTCNEQQWALLPVRPGDSRMAWIGYEH